MKKASDPAPAQDPVAADAIIKLACLAVGGQGGGVLASWIETTARNQGYACQTTSVAGVAQRTGSTIYYIEMAPQGDRPPVFSLAPSPGDVDIVIGAELMETGRAIMRGFVTPDRTTLIGSTHRVISIAEKLVPGDGVEKPDEIIAAAEIAANRLILLDLEEIATECGSVISASLFGALAASGALPFERGEFESAIGQGVKAAERSLRAFGVAYERVVEGVRSHAPPNRPYAPVSRVDGSSGLLDQWDALIRRLSDYPEAVQEMAERGLAAVVDYQDFAYGSEYLDRLSTIASIDGAAQDWQLTVQAAKYIARAMTYDDVIRVADLKTRGSRNRRIEEDLQPASEAVLRLTEFMHPRAEEIVGMFPAKMGRRWSDNPKRMQLLNRLFSRGRRIRSDRLRGFLALYLVGGMRKWRRKTLRHAQEQAHLDAWLNCVAEHGRRDYGLGVELVKCQRLIKGYSDTHARGNSKFQKVMGALEALQGRDDAADWIRRLREAALRDEQGEALDGALKTIASFA